MVSVACTCAPVNARWTSMVGGAGAAVTVEISQCSAAWTTAGRADRSSNTRDKGLLQVHTGGQTVRLDGFPPIRLRLSPEGESLHIYPYDHLLKFECLEQCRRLPAAGPRPPEYNNTTKLSMTDRGLAADTVYPYWVRAVSVAGGVGLTRSS